MKVTYTGGLEHLAERRAGLVVRQLAVV